MPAAGTASRISRWRYRTGMSDGTILDLVRPDRRATSHSDALYGANRTVPFGALGAPPISGFCGQGLSSPDYASRIAMCRRGDGDPLRDSNDALMVHSEAFGLHGVRRRVEATLEHESVQRTEVRLISWREVQ